MDRASLIRVLAQLGGPTAPTTLEKPSGPVDIAFFYGTLMHPDIIRKVIGNDGSHLRAAPAILQGWTRICVKYGHYPALITSQDARESLHMTLPEDQDHVFGVLVKTSNLKTSNDWMDSREYRREEVHPLQWGPFLSLSDFTLDESLAGTALASVDPESRPEGIRAYTYSWGASFSQLSPDPWSYTDFVQTNLALWTEAPKGSAAEQ